MQKFSTSGVPSAKISQVHKDRFGVLNNQFEPKGCQRFQTDDVQRHSQGAIRFFVATLTTKRKEWSTIVGKESSAIPKLFHFSRKGLYGNFAIHIRTAKLGGRSFRLVVVVERRMGCPT